MENAALIYAEFFGRCKGLVEMRDEEYIGDFDVVLRLRELIAYVDQLSQERKSA